MKQSLRYESERETVVVRHPATRLRRATGISCKDQSFLRSVKFQNDSLSFAMLVIYLNQSSA